MSSTNTNVIVQMFNKPLDKMVNPCQSLLLINVYEIFATVKPKGHWRHCKHGCYMYFNYAMIK